MSRIAKLLAYAAGAVIAVTSTPTLANGPLDGATGQFERNYLTFILNHHYSGLRATELAAGTAVVGPTASPGPWPATPASFPFTPAKATNAVALSVATMSNAMQRTEINEGEAFLQSWYGFVSPLTVPPAGQQLIDILTNATPGDPFNIAFLDNFSDHHVEAIARSTECINQAGHQALRDYCLGIVTAQAKDMDMMRDELSSTYGITGDAGAVPEPATWAMMLIGFGSIGLAMRRRLKVGTIAVAFGSDTSGRRLIC